MTNYATALPCPGTSMSCDIRADVSAVARVDASGWDISYSLYLIATNNSGYPSSGVTNYGHLYLEGGTYVNWAGTFSFPSGHGSGYTIGLGSSSYFKAVTPDGTGSLTVSFDFTEGGSPTIGSASSGAKGPYTLPTILRGPKIRATSWKNGPWKTKQTTQKPLVLKVKQSTWKPLI